jgi:hypothetical protein
MSPSSPPRSIRRLSFSPPLALLLVVLLLSSLLLAVASSAMGMPQPREGEKDSLWFMPNSTDLTMTFPQYTYTGQEGYCQEDRHEYHTPEQIAYWHSFADDGVLRNASEGSDTWIDGGIIPCPSTPTEEPTSTPSPTPTPTDSASPAATPPTATVDVPATSRVTAPDPAPAPPTVMRRHTTFKPTDPVIQQGELG